MNFPSWVKKHWPILLILFIGVFLRLYKAQALFLYSHDQDIASWIIRDIVEDKHFRLIGQETSSKGIFIGPAFYYALIPFYFLTRMDPVGGLLLSVFIGAATIISIYFVLKNIFNKNTALISSFIYALSFYTVMTDREVVPTTPAMLWSVWFFYAVWLLLHKKHFQGIVLVGILAGIIWHINLALALLIPVALLAIVLSKKMPHPKHIVLGAAAAIILSSPFLLFEARHNFQQTNAIVSALTTDKNQVAGAGSGFAKLDRTMQLVYKNATNIFYRTDFGFPAWFSFFVLVGVALYLLATKRIDEKLGFLMIIWQLLFIFFFTINPINLSEYYINGMNIIWIIVFSIAIAQMLEYRHYVPHVNLMLFCFAFLNLGTLANLPVNKSGYLERKAIVNFIKSDAAAHQYPCVAISYITTPGNDLGYRYLYYLEKMHVNPPKSGSPVYSIVFPHSMVNHIDHSFGALGLVLPDYSRYNEKSVKESCSGLNANLTDPVFGFTK